METSGQSAEGTRDSATVSGEVRRPTHGGLGWSPSGTKGLGPKIPVQSFTVAGHEEWG